jgi:hypothetical protein
MYENQNDKTTKSVVNGENKTEETTRKAPGLARFVLALRVWSLSASIIPTVLGELILTTTRDLYSNPLIPCYIQALQYHSAVQNSKTSA